MNQRGEITVLTVAIVFAVCALFSTLDVKTRSITHRTEITIKGSNNLVIVDGGTNIVEVSGSGGVTVPVSGAGK